MNTPNDSDNTPDFSFLGNDAVPDSVNDFDFSAAENAEQPSDELPADLPADVPDAPEFPDAASVAMEESPPQFDFPTESDSPATSTVPEAQPEAPKPPAAPKPVRRLTPKKRAAAPQPVAEPRRAEPDAGELLPDDDDAEPTREAETTEAPAADDAAELLPGDMVPRKTFTMLAGYAAALTLLFLTLLLTGRVNLAGPHPLESLPDIAPLKSNEFREVPVGVSLPENHTLKIGQSQRYGDILFTPLKVTREPIRFSNMISGDIQNDMDTRPVLKLWFKLENVSGSMAFPPWDVSLMSHRYPIEGTDESTSANSWLSVTQQDKETRILNYLHSPKSNFDIVGQNSRKMIEPGAELTAFVACSEQIAHVNTADSYCWRVQIRKGVNPESGNGVTTLIDVTFSQDDIGA